MQQPTKRKRDSRDEDAQKRKKPRVELRKRYRKARNVGDVLVNGVNLTKGHITGLLKEAIPEGQQMSLTIKDDSNKDICCIFSEFDLTVPDFNSRIGKHVQIALMSPERVSAGGISNSKYPFNLRFYQYSFTIDGEMFEATKGKDMASFVDDSSESDEEDVPSPPSVSSEPRPKPTDGKMAKTTAPSTTISRQGSGSVAIPLPSSLITIQEAITKLGALVNITGIIQNVTEPRQFSKKDWGLEIQLNDRSYDSRYFEVKLYASKKEHLPDHRSVGDGILLSGIKIGQRKGYLEGIGPTNKYRYCCFSKSANRVYASVMENADRETYESAPIHKPTEEELRALKILVNGESAVVNPRQQKDMDKVEEKLIEEIKLGDVFNCTALLLDVWNAESSADIKVTDYTPNPLLKDPVMARYTFPRGNQTLRITLFDKPADQARTMEVGKVYHIPRVRFSEQKGYVQGRCGIGKEGVMPVISEAKTQHPLVKNLLARKGAFDSGKKRPIPEPKLIAHTEPKQPAQPKEVPPTKQDPKPQATLATIDIPVVPAPPAPPPLKVYPAFPDYDGMINVCDSVVCAAPENHPLKTLKQIDDSQECPAIFRFHGRIVEIEPANLEEAIVAVCRECDSICTATQGNICPSCKRLGTIKTQVRMELVFQDASGLLGVKVGDDAAEKFLRLSKLALQAGNRDQLLKELSNRFKILMGSGSDLGNYTVGGISEIMEVVIKSWHVRRGAAGLDNAVWYRRHRVSGCRVNLDGH